VCADGQALGQQRVHERLRTAGRVEGDVDAAAVCGHAGDGDIVGGHEVVDVGLDLLGLDGRVVAVVLEDVVGRLGGVVGEGGRGGLGDGDRLGEAVEGVVGGAGAHLEGEEVHAGARDGEVGEAGLAGGWVELDGRVGGGQLA